MEDITNKIRNVNNCLFKMMLKLKYNDIVNTTLNYEIHINFQN